MATVTKTLDELVDAALVELVAPGETGRMITFGGDLTDSATTTTIADPTGVNPSDVIEVDNELIQVTAKSDDPTPVFTITRGFYGTTPAAHTASTSPGYVNPPFPRHRVATAVNRSLVRLESYGVQLVKTATLNRETGLAYVELPSDCRQVLQVLYWGTDGRLRDMQGWQDYHNLPTAKFSTGKMLNISYVVADSDDIEVVYRAPYRWDSYPSSPTGSSTVELPEGAEDLPSMYASAWALSSREISRSEIDRTEEWSRTEQMERGQTGALVRAKWQDFYRALDEARRVNPVPTPLVYRTRPKLT